MLFFKFLVNDRNTKSLIRSFCSFQAVASICSHVVDFTDRDIVATAL